MNIDFFVEKLELELRKQYNQCEDFSATSRSILSATLNAVASVKDAFQQNDEADGKDMPFGPEWETEMMRWSKKELVVELRRCLT